MSRNLGRKSHRAEQSSTHLKLANEITEVKSLLASSSQQTKELKARLNDLSERKKEAGKSPRNLQAPSNRFDIPIPKIRGLTTKTASPDITHASKSASDPDVTPGRKDSDLPPEDQPMFDHGSVYNMELLNSSYSTPGLPVLQLPTILSTAQPFEAGPSMGFDSEVQSEVEVPPFDLNVFNAMLDQGPLPEPTDEELAAHAFLRTVFGK
jgi:hypothetical protein